MSVRQDYDLFREEVFHLMKKNLKYVAIAFVVFYILKDPAGAAVTANNALGGLGNAGDAFGVFLSHLGK